MPGELADGLADTGLGRVPALCRRLTVPGGHVKAARPLEVFGLQAADEEVEAVGRLAAADVPPLHERGDLVQEQVLGCRVELTEGVRVAGGLDFLPLLPDGDRPARQVGDVLGDQADGRLEGLGLACWRAVSASAMRASKTSCGSDFACLGSTAW